MAEQMGKHYDTLNDYRFYRSSFQLGFTQSLKVRKDCWVMLLRYFKLLTDISWRAKSLNSI